MRLNAVSAEDAIVMLEGLHRHDISAASRSLTVDPFGILLHFFFGIYFWYPSRKIHIAAVVAMVWLTVYSLLMIFVGYSTRYS